MERRPSGTVTFLFSDIQGSTKLWEQHPERMQVAFARQEAIMRGAMSEEGGYVYKMIGDAFQVAFHTPLAALKAGLNAQLALQAEPWGDIGAIKVRMGLHTGTVEERGDDYVGPLLNRAARLMSVGHGGQILLSQVTYELLRDILPERVSIRDLGEHRLKDLNRPERVYQIAAPGLESDFPPLKTLDIFPNNLPLQLTSFVGREKEMAEIKRLLASTHLLSLTGPGGTGKTRLSLHVAADLLEAFQDGVWLVELASLSDPALVPQSVGDVLGVREEPGIPITTTLVDYLDPRSVLLVLDNCEHLVEACAHLAVTLLQACPHLKILTSSREALRVEGETCYYVPTLSLPDVRQLPVIESLTQYEAVRLFLDRAMAVRPDFGLTKANAPALANICERLDGMPLAIELAAGRVRAMSVEQIAARLGDRFRLLTGGSRTVLPRQQTLRALIDWSHDLLSEREQVLLRRLSVFRGGWSLEAAEVVCAGGGIDDREVLDLLVSLVDKSLVVADEQGRDMRYHMLETIRQYARGRLSEAGELEQVRSRHFDFFLMLAGEAEFELQREDQAAWLERLKTERDNFRSCLEWAQGSGEAVLGLRLLQPLRIFWENIFSLSEYQDLLTRLLEIAPQPTLERAWGLKALGTRVYNQGDYPAALRLYEESLALSEALSEQAAVAEAVFMLSWPVYALGDRDRSYQLLERSLGLFQDLGNRERVAFVTLVFGELARAEGDLSRALELHEQSVILHRDLAFSRLLPIALFNLSLVLIHFGEFERSRDLLRESITIEMDWNSSDTYCRLFGFACLEAARGQAWRAARLFSASETMRKALGQHIDVGDQRDYDRTLASLHEQLDEDEFQAAWAEGERLTLEQAIALALSEEPD